MMRLWSGLHEHVLQLFSIQQHPFGSPCRCCCVHVCLHFCIVGTLLLKAASVVLLALIWAHLVGLPYVSCKCIALHIALELHALLPVGLGRNLCCASGSVLPDATMPSGCAAGIMAAAPLTQKKLSDHTYMIVGEGRAATHIAEMITVGTPNRPPMSVQGEARHMLTTIGVQCERHAACAQGHTVK